MNAYDVIIMPWLTEKTMEARTTQNRLEFIVRRAATKKQIARAVETIFEVEVESVNVRNTKHGNCLLYTSPSPRDQCLSRMPSSA